MKTRFLVPLLLLINATLLPMRIHGQDRMPPIPADKWTDAQRKAAAEFKEARGADLSGPFVPLFRSPEVMNRARAMGDYLRFRSVLPPRLSEFVILMTARQWRQTYEWGAHYPIAISAGMKPETGKAIAEGRRPAELTDDEAVLYDFCTELQATQHVSDALYSRAVSKFGEQGVIDTVGIVGYYTMLAMVLNTAQTPAASGADVPKLPPVPSR